jgi:general secretion pathway protein H
LLLSRRAGRRSLFRPALPSLSVACGFRATGWQSALQLATATLAPAFGASGRAVRLPADVPVKAVLATRCNNRPAGATIRHLPSGMSCGGAIALTREAVGYQVRVNWLTGGVDVVPVN